MSDVSGDDWLAYCRGDDSAMDRIFRQCKDRLYTYCLLVTRQRGLSEDIVQESFVRLMVQRKKQAEIQSVAGWLFICARNQIRSHLSKARNETSADSVPDIPAPGADPEVARFVERVLTRLEPEERDLILLREYQQFSIGELAAMLEISEEAVRVRLYRIRKKMQSLIRE